MMAPPLGGWDDEPLIEGSLGVAAFGADEPGDEDGPLEDGAGSELEDEESLGGSALLSLGVAFWLLLVDWS